MLEAKGIWKNYGDLDVLRGIDLFIEQKEIVSIVGASGAGKSTLLHILGTLDRATKGTLKIKEEEVSKFKGKKLSSFRNQEIGFVFQFHNLFPEFTALENVCIPGFIAGTPDHVVRQEAKNLLEVLGLSERANHRPSQLSGGEQQRVSVARALINKPSLVFADEPSGNLDSQNANELHSIFLKLRDDFGQSFVIVTHNNDLASLSDRTLTMKDGLIIS